MRKLGKRMIGLNLAFLVVLSIFCPNTAYAADSSYSIYVGGHYFQSDTKQSGTGWEYESGWLSLSDYNGGPIRASGDLRIFLTGTSSITGSSGRYADNGITVDGTLRMYALKSNVSLTVIGGSGTVSDGHGILADSVRVGDEGHYTFQGGSGSTGGAGVFFRSSCQFGAIFATISSGKSYTNAVRTSSTNSWYYDYHTTLSGNSSYRIITPNRYKLTLKGAPGHVHNGTATFTSLTNYYPTYYSLAEYCFERNGYVQVAWSTPGSLMPLNRYFMPSSDTTLNAVWEQVNAGDILLNGMGGRFENNSYYKKYSSSTVTLPSTLLYGTSPYTYNGNANVWRTDPVPLSDSQKLFGGQWYTSGSKIKPSSGTVVLYGQCSGEGTFAFYDPSEGNIKQGGNVLVQGIYSTGSNLTVYAIDGSNLNAPGDKTFSGWAESKNGKVKYYPGDAVTIGSGQCKKLYAVWEELFIPASGVTVRLNTQRKAATVTLSDTWCKSHGVKSGIVALYDNNSRMISCSTAQYVRGQDTVLEVSYSGDKPYECRIFSLNASMAPVTSSLSVKFGL